MKKLIIILIIICVSGNILIYKVNGSERFNLIKVSNNSSRYNSLYYEEKILSRFGNKVQSFDIKTGKNIFSDNLTQPDSNYPLYIIKKDVLAMIDDYYLKAFSVTSMKLLKKTRIPNLGYIVNYSMNFDESDKLYVSVAYVNESEETCEYLSEIKCFDNNREKWKITRPAEYINSIFYYKGKLIALGNDILVIEAQNGKMETLININSPINIGKPLQKNNLLYIPNDNKILVFNLDTSSIVEYKYKIKKGKDNIIAPIYMDDCYCILATSFSAFFGSNTLGDKCKLYVFDISGILLWEKVLNAEINYSPIIYKEKIIIPVNYLDNSKSDRLLVYDLKGNLLGKTFSQKLGWPQSMVVYNNELYITSDTGIYKLK